MNYLLIAGSLRKDSLNKKLLKNAQTALAAQTGVNIVVADLKSLEIPVYDGDVETQGIPAGVQTLGKMVMSADAIVICSPEYNGSMAGPMKNTVDWVSRLRPIPWEGKPVLLMGASPGQFGASRGLASLRLPFEALGSYVYPSTLALPRAHEAFDGEDKLTDAKTLQRMSELLTKFGQFAQKLKQ